MINTSWYFYQDQSFWNGYTIFKKIITNMAYSSTLSILILFFVLVISASLLFEFLNQKIDMMLLLLHNSSSTECALIELNKWKRHHWMVSQLVDRINDCFGMIVFLSVLRGFVSFISYAYSMAFASNKNDAFWELYYLIVFVNEFFHLWLAVYPPYFLQSEVMLYKQ